MPRDDTSSNVCEETRKRILLAPQGKALPPPQRAQVETHLAGCEPCRAFADLAAEADGLLAGAIQDAREHGPEEAEHFPLPPDDVVARVVRRVHAQSPASARRTGRIRAAWSRLRAAPQGVLAAAAAALLILSLSQAILVWRLTGRTSGPMPDAPAYLKETDTLKTQLAAVQRQLDNVLGELAAQPHGPYAFSSQARQQAVELVRATYFPQSDITINPVDLTALMDVVQGTTLFSAGQYERAVARFRQAADMFSNVRFKTLSLFALGTSQKCAHDYQASLATYDRILGITEGANASGATTPRQAAELSAHRAMAHHFKGWSYHRLASQEADGREYATALHTLDRAQECYRRALAITPAYAKVRFNMGLLSAARARIFETMGQTAKQKASLAASTRQLNEAERDLRRRLRTRPTDAKAHFSLAMVYAHQQRKGEAIEQLKAAVELDSSLAFLLASERAFDHLADTETYQELVQQAKQSGERITVVSLFTDADFPTFAPTEGH